MIRINLLPREIYAARAQQQLQKVGLGVAAVVVAVFLGYFAWIVKTEASLKKQLAEARVEETKYQAIANEVQALEIKKQQLSTRYSVIQQLVAGTLVYPRFFEDFMALLPADVWIGTLATNTDPSYGLSVAVSAQALSAFAVADWLTNLQSSPLCSDVKLGAISVTEDAEGKATIYAFSMNFVYRRSG